MNVDLNLGDDFKTAAKEAINKREMLGVDCRLTIGDLTITVYKNSTVESLATDYNNMLDSIGDCIGNSPSAIVEKASKQAALTVKTEGVALKIVDQHEWDQFVNTSTSPLGIACVEFAKNWGKLMQIEIDAGASLDNIAERTLDEADITGLLGSAVTRTTLALAVTWKHGEELRQWHTRNNSLEAIAKPAPQRG